jgi:hypothetical protein
MNMATVSFISVLAAVGFHYEFLSVTSRVVQRLPGPHRLRVAVAIVLAVAAHLFEVLLFAVGWWWCSVGGEAALTLAEPSFGDLVYFSGVVYTSLGFGDVVPVGDGRGLAIAEAVTGLVLIAWTASFTYFEMLTNWPLASRKQN